MTPSRELGTEPADHQAVEEIQLVTELMVVASLASGELEQAAVDQALGLSAGAAPLPEQRASH